MNFEDWATYLLRQLRRAVMLTADPVLVALDEEVRSHPNVAAVPGSPKISEWDARPTLAAREYPRLRRQTTRCQGTTMEYCFSQNPPISEEEALAQAAEMGFHALAYDYSNEVDEPLHWHEFDSVTWLIDGTGAFVDERGNVTHLTPGCRLDAPAGWLHRNLASGPARVVLSTNLPGETWTMPINKDPADRPVHLAV